MKTVALGLAASIALFSAPSARAEEEKVDTSQIRIRKAIEETLTPEQLQARKERLARRIAAARRAGRTILGGLNLPADTCPAATAEGSALPFGPVSDTTVGMTDDYEPALSSTLTCSAPTNCTGTPSGRGEVYSGTGWGPDRAYRIRTSANCSLTIDLHPSDPPATADDLSLMVYQAQCTNELVDCACVSDTGFPTNPAGNDEQVVLDALSGTDYFVVIDGYSSSGAPPGEEGPFTLTISGTGCSLVSQGGDLGITKTDGQTSYFPGQTLTYTITATNLGSTTLTGATVTDTFPADLGGVSWTCAASAGSACGSASGMGNINATVDLLSLGTATFTVTATASVAAAGSISNTATVAAPTGVTDPDLSNNSATDTDTRRAGAYHTIAPCRLIDTRDPNGAFGGPALNAGAARTFDVNAGACPIPTSATAVFLNVTVVSPTVGGNLRIFPTGTPLPTVSALNYSAGQTRGNNGVYSVNASGQLEIFCAQASGTAQVVVDVAGYFVE